MSQEPPAKRVRKGTKSCTECRRRKVRCVWPTATAETCEFCQARGLTCEQQVAQTPAADVVRVTTRARLAHLERNMGSIWSAIHDLQTKSGIEKTSHNTQANFHDHNGDAGHEEDDDSDSESSEDLSPPNAPTHLLQLFDNHLLGSHHGRGPGTPAPGAYSAPHKGQNINALKALMPSREDMGVIVAYAASWLSMYASLFPMVNMNKSSSEMLAQYDQLQDLNADPVAIAALLLYITLTVQQAPEEIASRTKSMKDPHAFIKDVAETVDRVVISDDSLSCSLEGIQMCILYTRFQLGRAKVTKMWLLLRRVIALAELLGLPRAAMALAQIQESNSHGSNGASSMHQPLDRLRQKAETWESLCALDRIISMMWSLPLATTNFPLPKRAIIDARGEVIPQSYLYNLADIASRVLELDSIYSSGKPLSELFNAAMRTDHELRSLAGYPPKSWWRVQFEELSIDALLQYWNQYITVRTHLQLALTYDESKQQFAMNFITCLNACQELASRYTALRPILPAGFFANWVIDMQAFTAAVFLLLASYRITRGSGSFPQAFDVNFTAKLVEQTVHTMESSISRSGEGFAHPAASAIKSLDSLLREPQAPEQNISLSLPLVGTIQISRKAGRPLRQQQGLPPTPGGQLSGTFSQSSTYADPESSMAPTAIPYTSEAMELMDSLSYSMEIPESYPFLTDDIFGSNEQWLTWSA